LSTAVTHRPTKAKGRGRKAAVAGRERARRKTRWIFGGIIGIVIAVFAAAIIMSRPDAASDRANGLVQTQTSTITGEALPGYPEDGSADPAIGQTAPSVSGKSFDGNAVAIRADNRPKMILFLAHWCNHCQAEVPLVQSWIDSGAAPGDVDFYSVSTAVDANQPNYPPSAWLEREGWAPPVLADDEAGSVADAFGIGGFPFFVFVDGDGKVVQRSAGRIPIETIESYLAALPRPEGRTDH
jgi:thiol-disulfide isomerase/thioredoxin